MYNGAYLSVDMKNDKKEIVGSMFPVSWDIRSVDVHSAGVYR